MYRKISVPFFTVFSSLLFIWDGVCAMWVSSGEEYLFLFQLLALRADKAYVYQVRLIKGKKFNLCYK